MTFSKPYRTFHNLTSWGNIAQRHQARAHSGHQGRYLQGPDAGSSLGPLIFFLNTTEYLISQSKGKTGGRGWLNTPFFLEGESLCWLLEGVEVATLAGTTSTLSVGEIGLREHALLSDARGSPGGAAAVVAARGSGLTTVRSGGGAPPSSSSVPLCMASELRITRKWVLSEGVMVTVFSASGFSFLLNWTTGIRGRGQMVKVCSSEQTREALTLVVSGNSPQVHCM